MYFTPQQLSGGNSYSQKTRIGNWYEDQEAVDGRIKDYMQMKESDKLVMNHSQQKFAKSAQRVSISHRNLQHSKL